MSIQENIRTSINQLQNEDGLLLMLPTYADPTLTEAPAADVDTFRSLATSERLLASLRLHAEVSGYRSDGYYNDEARCFLAEVIDTDDLITNTAHYLLDYSSFDIIGTQTAKDHLFDSYESDRPWYEVARSAAFIPHDIDVDTMFGMRNAWNTHVAEVAYDDELLRDTLADYALGTTRHARAATQALLVHPDDPVTLRVAEALLAEHHPGHEMSSARLPVDDVVAGMLWDHQPQTLHEHLRPDHLLSAINHDTLGSISAKALAHACHYLNDQDMEPVVARASARSAANGYTNFMEIWNEAKGLYTPDLLNREPYVTAMQDAHPELFYTLAAQRDDIDPAIATLTAARAAHHAAGIPGQSIAASWAIAHGATLSERNAQHYTPDDLITKTNMQLFLRQPTPFVEHFGLDALTHVLQHPRMKEEDRDHFLRALLESPAT